RALRVAALSRAGAMTEQFKSDSAVAVPGPTEEHGYVVFNADEWMPVCDFESRLRPGLAKPETLDEAAEEQDLPAIAAILSAQVPSQSALTNALVSAAHCPYDNSAVIVRLVQAGADVNGRSSVPPYDSPLTAVVVQRGTRNLTALLALGANPAQPARKGETPLELARRNNPEAAQLLAKAMRANPRLL